MDGRDGRHAAGGSHVSVAHAQARTGQRLPVSCGRPTRRHAGLVLTPSSVVSSERPAEHSRTGLDEARRVLAGYRAGVLSLESLISWAEALEASDPADPWLRRTAQSLADPLLCRERAMAFVRDLLGD